MDVNKLKYKNIINECQQLLELLCDKNKLIMEINELLYNYPELKKDDIKTLLYCICEDKCISIDLYKPIVDYYIMRIRF